MATRRTPNQRAGSQATRRAIHAIRRRMFVTPGEMRARETQFERDIRAQMQQFDRGPRSTETREQFIDRHGKQLITLLARYMPLLSGFRLPATRGRRPRLDREPRPKKQSGGQVKIPPDVEQRLVTAIDRIRARAAADGRKLTDDRALFLYMLKLFTESHITAGLAPREARRLAKEQAIARWDSPGFRKKMERLKERLSRARRARKTRR